jgi:carbamoylphosphate synthase large subunit
MELLREGYGNKCYIIGSNDKEFCVYKMSCDEFIQEPIFEDEKEYVEWAKNFCKEHSVDVFFPRRNMVAIANHVSEFNEMGVKVVLSSDFPTMELFNDKAETYKRMKENNLVAVPEIEIVNNVNDFITAYDKIKSIYPEDRVVFKYSCGEGATSFRVIDHKVADISVLDTGAGLKLTYEDAIKLLSTVESFPDLMVMPYLKGPEISIDCIAGSNGEFAGICRNKLGSRVTEIHQNEELLEISKNIATKFNLFGPFNIQFRMHNGIPYLLEINTRMSGGVHLSCLTGLNIPYLASEKAQGKDIEIPEYKKDTFKVSQVETPIILN